MPGISPLPVRSQHQSRMRALVDQASRLAGEGRPTSRSSRPARSVGAQFAPLAATASRITFATSAGRDCCGTWLAGRSVTLAPSFFRHRALQAGIDHAVARADDKPRRLARPGGIGHPVAEGPGLDRPLGRAHHGGLRGRHVLGEVFAHRSTLFLSLSRTPASPRPAICGSSATSSYTTCASFCRGRHRPPRRRPPAPPRESPTGSVSSCRDRY